MSILSLVALSGIFSAGVADLSGESPPCEPPCNIETEFVFSHTYSDNYRTGEPYDYLTIHPDGSGDTFADIGVTIRMRILSCGHCTGPYAGIPATDIIAYDANLEFCQPKYADADSDADGWFSFSGTLAAGGCAQGLDIYTDGYYMATVAVNFNSPDTGLASPGFIDSADLTAFSRLLGDPSAWDICSDFNESGPPTIDSADLAYLAGTLGAACN